MQRKRTNVTQISIQKLVKYGLSPLILAVALLIGLFIVNYIAALKSPNFDVTKYKLNTLSKESYTLLDTIDYDISIKAFYSDDMFTDQIQSLLEKYAQANDHITVEFIDPIRNPIIAKEYDVDMPGAVIFEAQDKQSRLDPPAPGLMHSERTVSIALYRLMTEQTKKIYFTAGHGEALLTTTGPRGVSSLLTRLIEQNYIVDTVNLFDNNGIPRDCTTLVIVGPTAPFLEQEISMINAYLADEGTIMVLVNADTQPNLDGLFKSYNLVLGNDYIYETSTKMTIPEYGPLYLFCRAENDTEILTNLTNQNFFFPLVRSVLPAESSDVRITRLLSTSVDSWAETDLESMRAISANYKPKRDANELKGPVCVAVATERRFALPDSLRVGDDEFKFIRSAFFGNANFITNSAVAPFPANIDLFLNTLNWITNNENIIDIIPHEAVFTPVNITIEQRRRLSWLTILLYPGVILFLGIAAWYRRR